MVEQANKVAIITGGSPGAGAAVAFLVGPDSSWINGRRAMQRRNGLYETPVWREPLASAITC